MNTKYPAFRMRRHGVKSESQFVVCASRSRLWPVVSSWGAPEGAQRADTAVKDKAAAIDFIANTLESCSKVGHGVWRELQDQSALAQSCTFRFIMATTPGNAMAFYWHARWSHTMPLPRWRFHSGYAAPCLKFRVSMRPSSAAFIAA